MHKIMRHTTFSWTCFEEHGLSFTRKPNFSSPEQASSPVLDKVNCETITKDLKRQEGGKKSHKTYMKKLKDRFLKDNQMAHITLKGIIDQFHQDLNDLASTLIVVEETICIMKEEHKLKIYKLEWSEYIKQ